MKTGIIFSLLIISLQVCGQKLNVNKVPENVVLDFDNFYPDAVVSSWEQTDKGIVVAFISKDENVKALYNIDGNRILSYTQVDKSEVPAQAMEYFNSNYAVKGFQILRYGFTQEGSGKSYYQLDIQSLAVKNKITELHFGVAGDFMDSSDITETLSVSDETGIKGVKSYKSILPSALPEKILTGIKNTYKGFKIKQSASVISGDNPDGYYVVLRKAGKTQSVELFYDKFSEIVDKIEPEAAIAEDIEAQEGSSEFDPGAYKMSEEINAKELPSKIMDYIKANYKNYKITLSEHMIQEGLPEAYHVNVKNMGEEDADELYFDISGKLLKKTEPYEKDLNGDENNQVGDVNYESGDEGSALKPNTVISAKELPSDASTFIKRNYREYTVKKVMYIDNEEMHNVYFVQVKWQADPVIDLYFDYQGGLVKNSDPNWKKKQEEAAQAKAAEKPKITQNDIPEVVTKNFAKKNPKAEDVIWEIADNDYVASYYVNDLKAKSVYTKDGAWVCTSNTYDKGRLSNMIKTYISKNYGSYKIDYSMLVQRADKKNHYLVVLYKKIKGGKEYVGLKFNTSGKFIEVDESVNPENGEQ